MVASLVLVLLLLGSALGAQKCPKKSGTSQITGEFFYQYQATTILTGGGRYPTYDPLSKVFKRANSECRRTCESTDRCAAWFLNSAGSSGGGSVYCSLYEKNTYKVETGADVCTGREYCRTGVCR